MDDSGIFGWFDFADLYERAVERTPHGGVIVEVGCLLGKSTAYMATEIVYSRKSIAFFAIDTWKGSASDIPVSELVAQHGGDMFPAFWRNMQACGVDRAITPIQLPSVEAAKQFVDGSCDFVFIDADHSPEAVRDDIRAWLPKVKPGGTLAGHDFPHATVGDVVKAELPGYQVMGSSWYIDIPGRND